ncbi:MAG: hypothetical protein EZS28_038730 [Streblomastix strix]|uniref:Uncharacterized protein n=1 Tax=Streblomastix strix TaxID=222440 RepID=A0A5J4U6F6_9EUKA|nr:MAG: hypothetical protein EZS28_038730 [Streblomastix strix]
MNKLIDSKDQEVINDVVWIIYWIIKAENKELKEGQQHPSNQILTNDGTVANLIRIIQDKDKENIHHDIALIFSYIFKTLPLPEDIKKQVLQQLKYHDDFDEIAYLAECPENHDVILSDSFVNELFKEFREYDTLQYLRLTILLLQLGSNPNKKKVALSVKDKVIRLTIDEYVDQLDDKYNWDEDKIQEINSNSRQAVQLIKSIEEEIEQEGEFEEINGIQFHINEDI